MRPNPKSLAISFDTWLKKLDPGLFHSHEKAGHKIWLPLYHACHTSLCDVIEMMLGNVLCAFYGTVSCMPSTWNFFCWGGGIHNCSRLVPGRFELFYMKQIRPVQVWQVLCNVLVLHLHVLYVILLHHDKAKYFCICTENVFLNCWIQNSHLFGVCKITQSVKETLSQVRYLCF